MSDPKLTDEEGRLAALNRYDVLDSEPEQPFEKITKLVSAVLNVPICAVSLIDRDRQWFKSKQGLYLQQTSRSISFCTHTIKAHEPLVIADALADERFCDNPLVLGPPFIRSYAGVPLRSPDGYNLGALCAIDINPRQFSDDQISILKSFSALVVDELELRRIADRDHLTGALTRRGFLAQLDKEIARHQRHARASALLMFDVDHFKKINDGYGHPLGDAVLKAVSECCENALRPTDTFGRLGGEEFGILLSETTASDALLAAERFRMAIAQMRLCEHPELRVTASFGVAPITAERCKPGTWLSDADEAMYLAKRQGRDRCCTTGSETVLTTVASPPGPLASIAA
jgi:diguanylate cyclase (GGDEF)-like protein